MNPNVQRLIELALSYNGAALNNDREADLRQLLSRSGIDNPQTLLSPKVSTCGLFVLGIWYAAGVKHALLDHPYEVGKAIAWVRTIAFDAQALRKPSDGLPMAGAVLHYFTHGQNNNHVEILCADPDVVHGAALALHCGGGRPNCGVGEATSNIFWSSGRPLQEWIDLNLLLPEVDEDAYGPEEPPTAR